LQRRGGEESGTGLLRVVAQKKNSYTVKLARSVPNYNGKNTLGAMEDKKERKKFLSGRNDDPHGVKNLG